MYGKVVHTEQETRVSNLKNRVGSQSMRYSSVNQNALQKFVTFREAGNKSQTGSIGLQSIDSSKKQRLSLGPDQIAGLMQQVAAQNVKAQQMLAA